MIEMVVALVIIGIISAAMIRPVITGMLGKTELFSAVRLLETELHHLREKAMLTNLLQRIVFHPASADYEIYGQHVTQNIWVEDLHVPGIEVSVEVASTSLADNQVIFGTDGVPYEDNQTDLPDASTDLALSVTRDITIENSGGQQYLIRITPDTGHIYSEGP